MNPTLADLLSPRTRAWVYAIAGIVVPLLSLLALLYEAFVMPSLIVSAVLGFAGFQLARANTPAGSPPPGIDALNVPE